MNQINSIGFALDPANVPSFLLDWELTKLCNLDCSYCPDGEEQGDFAGHDNTKDHPSLAECLDTIDFMYEYVDQYMRYKKPNQRKVILNVYGGESLFHPDIVEILEACRTKHTNRYKDSWYLTITCTTNAIVGENHWEKIHPLVDEFTLSYHSEALPKQKELFKNNCLRLTEVNKKYRAVVVMHNQEPYWSDCLDILEFFKAHNIRYQPRALDNHEPEWNYTPDMFNKFKTFWIDQVSDRQKVNYKKELDKVFDDTTNESITKGRACCGGRSLSINGDLRSCVNFVPKQGFRDWSCSVNWFFLFIQQSTGNVYTNKDCRTSTTGRVEPLGNLGNSKLIVDTLKQQLDTNTMPVIQCVKDICVCGFCAPKAESMVDFKNLIFRNVTQDVFEK
jgi:sulfatase maturation enzyme AslB (radical SAM superfamily)